MFVSNFFFFKNLSNVSLIKKLLPFNPTGVLSFAYFTLFLLIKGSLTIALLRTSTLM